MMINENINKSVNLETYSMTLTKILMSSRKNEKNSLREQTLIVINISIDSNLFSFAIFISYQSPSFLSSHFYYFYKDLYHFFIYNHHREYFSYTFISSRNNIMTSSSIIFEIENNRDKLINYFN